MKLLVVSPDYASHYLPLSAIAGAARRRSVEVTIATGPTLRSCVERDGYRWRELRMSAGSNPGLLSDRSPLDMVDDLSDFFAATRRGMVAALRHQAGARASDLLWEPEHVARSMIALADEEAPDAVLVDHLAFACTLGLRAAGRRFTTFVPGHPSQLPVGDERYGSPVAWPSTVQPDADELVELRARCDAVTRSFTDRYNEVAQALTPAIETVDDAFAAHGDDVLFNSPAALRRPERDCDLPARHAFLGSCVRNERPSADVQAWLDATGDRPYVYASFGTFLSTRVDVLRQVVLALTDLDVAAALSTGTADPAELGPVPPHWLVADSLPQVALLAQAQSVVTHGGNGTVTEALTAGLPMVVLPFSTDQFAIAADLELAGLGIPLDPNSATPAALAQAISATFADPTRRRAGALGERLRCRPGNEVAVDRLLGAP